MNRVLLGYQTVRLDTSALAVETGRWLIESSARERSVAASAVSRLLDLGLLPIVQREIRDRLQRETGLPVEVLRVIA